MPLIHTTRPSAWPTAGARRSTPGLRASLLLTLAVVVAFPLSAVAGFVYSSFAATASVDYLVQSATSNYHCGEGRSAVGDSADPGEQRGEIQSRIDNNIGFGCTGSTQNVQPGYLGVATRGWYDPDNDGSFTLCNYTNYAYSSVSAYGFAVGASLCPNPAGADEYYAEARITHGWDSGGGVAYDSSSWGFTSPKQSY